MQLDLLHYCFIMSYKCAFKCTLFTAVPTPLFIESIRVLVLHSRGISKIAYSYTTTASDDSAPTTHMRRDISNGEKSLKNRQVFSSLQFSTGHIRNGYIYLHSELS